jgi:hypothetical protein
MSLVNRSIVIVYARQPFIDWVNTILPEPVSFEEINTGCPAFMIEDFEYEEDALDAVNDEWEVFFETWLESWVPDESKWPRNRTVEQFHEWFDVSLHPAVFDRLDEPVVHEDEGDDSAVDSGEGEGSGGGAGGDNPKRALH